MQPHPPMNNQPLLRAEDAIISLNESKFDNKDADKAHFYTLYKSLEDF